MSSFRLAYLSLIRRRVPTLITILAIALSVATSGILLRLYRISASRFNSMGEGYEAIIGAKAGGIEILLNATNGEGEYPDFLPYALYQSLHAGSEVHFEDGASSTPKFLKNVSPFLYFGVYQNFKAAGTDENFIKTGFADATPFASGNYPARPTEIALGAAVAEQSGLKLNDEIIVQSSLSESTAARFRVSGILKPARSAWDRLLYTSVESAQGVLAAGPSALKAHSIWGAKVLNYFFINLDEGGFEPLRDLVNKRTVGQLIAVDKEKAKLEQLTGAGKTIGLFVSLFVLLLAALSVSSLLITRFEAMSVQLAVLRALGHSRADVAGWLLWEGFLLGAGGAILGAALDGLIFPELRSILGTALPPVELVKSGWWESYPIWILALLATTFAVFIPLIRLYRQDVHQALKG